MGPNVNETTFMLGAKVKKKKKKKPFVGNKKLTRKFAHKNTYFKVGPVKRVCGSTPLWMVGIRDPFKLDPNTTRLCNFLIFFFLSLASLCVSRTPMAMVTLASAVNTNPSWTLPFGNDSSNLCDASFSAYLNGTEETFIRKLADSSRNLMPFIMTTAHGDQQADVERKRKTMKQLKSLEHRSISKEDEEIGVFGVEGTSKED
jgi:hypothetical protein